MLSGSVGKASNLAAPDLVMSTLPDVQDHVRRVTRNTDIPIMVDAEDGFGNALNVWRCVRELEAAASRTRNSQGGGDVAELKGKQADPGLAVRSSASTSSRNAERIPEVGRKP